MDTCDRASNKGVLGSQESTSPSTGIDPSVNYRTLPGHCWPSSRRRAQRALRWRRRSTRSQLSVVLARAPRGCRALLVSRAVLGATPEAWCTSSVWKAWTNAVKENARASADACADGRHRLGRPRSRHVHTMDTAYACHVQALYRTYRTRRA